MRLRNPDQPQGSHRPDYSVLILRGFACLGGVLARSSDTLPNRSLGLLAGYHADLREPGSELIEVAGSLGIPAEPSAFERPARSVCHQPMETILRFALARVIARRQRWAKVACWPGLRV